MTSGLLLPKPGSALLTTSARRAARSVLRGALVAPDLCGRLVGIVATTCTGATSPMWPIIPWFLTAVAPTLTVPVLWAAVMVATLLHRRSPRSRGRHTGGGAHGRVLA